MIVVLDTCIFDRDRLMSGGDFDRLKTGVDRLGIELVLPDVVRREYLKHVRKQATEAYKKFISAAGDLTGISGQDVRAGEIDLDACVAQAEVAAIARLATLRTRLVDLPEVRINDILQRDLDAIKPFDSDGKGMRDTLILLSVIEIAKATDSAVVFVSSNHNDFAEKEDKNRFHKDIADEIEREVENYERVKLLNSLSEFNARYILPRLERVEEVQLALVNDGQWLTFDLDQEVETGIGTYLKRTVDEARRVATNLRQGQTIDLVLSKVEQIRVDGVLHLSETELLVLVFVRMELEMSILDGARDFGDVDLDRLGMSWEQRPGDFGKRPFFRTGPIGIQFGTSNTQYSQARCLITLDSTTAEVKSFDVAIEEIRETPYPPLVDA